MKGILICLCQCIALIAGADELKSNFATPPASARPWVYWYFMDGNLTREGMTADLEAMKKAGIGGAIFLEVNIGIPRGPVEFMSPQWQDLVVHGFHEAERLGIEIALGTGPGWCGTGGPWLKPEQTMQHLVASETNVVGPAKFSAVLPQPQPRVPYFGEKTLTPQLKEQWQKFYQDEAVVAFPALEGSSRIADVNEKALYHRDPYSSKKGVKPFLTALEKFSSQPLNQMIPLGKTVDLTKNLSVDGQLVWDVPPGKWTIMRFGRTLTGQTTRPAPQPGLGFESDKFTRAALDAHFSAFIAKLLTKPGSDRKSNGGLTTLHFDSWEMGSQNWSKAFRAEFQKRRGYDPLKYLPAFTGVIVESEEVSERFLWDVRRTAQELVVDNHVGYLADLAHQNGLKLSLEPYDLNPAGDLTLGRVADVPQCEFWYLGYDTFYTVIEAASIAHTCGRNVVAAESFTSSPGEDWKAGPGELKSMGDWAFCAGVNRIAFHRFQAQPRNDQKPGMTMGSYGVHWDRTQTWWDMARPYHDYLARCQSLLQRGVSVADVCYLAAEGAPHVFRAPDSALTGTPPDHSGYNFDGCAPESLLERATVSDGKIAFPGGTAYRILVLPERQTMTPALLRKIGSLVREGATVFGPPPGKSPSLADLPKGDAEVKKLAQEIWGDCDGKKVFEHSYGKGRVIWRQTEVKPGEAYGDFAAITSVLADMGVEPDFESNGPIRSIHRHDGGADIYFLANREARSINATCVFRIGGKVPELFDPLTGATRTLPQFSMRGERTEIPLRFESGQSFFVVFRPAVKGARAGGDNFPVLTSMQKMDGPWEVSFDPAWGGPARVTFDALDDWSQRPEEGIKYYSGTAFYRKSFDAPQDAPTAGRRYFLDLGSVKNLARVKLNGRDCGVAWCPPWRVEVTDALAGGVNRLEIEVANYWPNRLIGDQFLPEDKRFTRTTRNPFKTTSPLLPSGLLGPVQVLTAQNQNP